MMGNESNQPTEIRHTVIADSVAIDKVKYIAWQERKQLKKTIGEALEDYIAKWEKKNGAITPVMIKKMEESK
jgi:hypothetical protein